MILRFDLQNFAVYNARNRNRRQGRQGLDIVFQSKLANKTWEHLRARSRLVTYAHISEATGVSVRWLEAFAACQVKDPSCAKVELIYEFLTGAELDV